jgi:ribosomal protein S18 acetylase RimI-like enzyme
MPIDWRTKQDTGARPLVAIRVVEADDSADILRWRNDETTRAMSLNSSVIDEIAHQRWFSAILANANHFGFVGVVNGRTVGWVRFDPLIGRDRFRANIVIAPEARGCGVGSVLLGSSIAALFRIRAGAQVEAEIKRNNPASLQLFRKQGFRIVREDEIMARFYLDSEDHGELV